MTAGMPSFRHFALIALGLAPMVGAGCRTATKHERNRIPQLGAIEPSLPKELDKVTLPPRIVEPPDEIEVHVRPADPDFPGPRFVVQPEGTIDLGEAGEIFVAGLNVRQIEVKLLGHLAALASAKGARPPTGLSVRISENASKFYYVVGTVSNPSRYPIDGNTTVLDAILRAGLKSNSVPEKAYLVRPHPAGAADQIFQIDWFGIVQRGDTLTNYQLLPGDRVFVPGTRPPSAIASLFGGG